MEKLFQYIGKKAGQTVKKSKWIYNSVFGDEKAVVESEYQVGLYMAKDIQSNYKLSRSQAINEIGSKLVKIVNTSHKFTFIKLESNEVNAFALPGGFIFLHSAIIDFCKGDANLIAFILSHEMAHVIKGHSFERLLAEYSISTINRLIKATGLIQQAAKQLTTKYLIAKYSRENEFEADEFAVKLMSAAEYDSKGAIEFFNKLEKLSKDNSILMEYFSTHPPVESRISNVKTLI